MGREENMKRNIDKKLICKDLEILKKASGIKGYILGVWERPPTKEQVSEIPLLSIIISQ